MAQEEHKERKEKAWDDEKPDLSKVKGKYEIKIKGDKK
jgi:hypothetical protein